MTTAGQHRARIAIACGGTGGHFFPGIAVAENFRLQGCDVLLFVSTKQVDQEALKSVPHLRAISLPAAALTRARTLGSVVGFLKSLSVARSTLRREPCDAVLAMGGFTSAPPVLVGRRNRAAIFLHESNTIPGRANQWLSSLADLCFVGFPQTANHLRKRRVVITGTPVRPQFIPGDACAARKALNLDPAVPLLLVTGGSQGASALNSLAPQAATLLRDMGSIQVLHLTGAHGASSVASAYQNAGIHARVLPFLDRMDLALQAATAAITRAGASSLAELAATRVPSVLIPYPSAAGNHQFHNASAFSGSGAAFLLTQSEATPRSLATALEPLLKNTTDRQKMVAALGQWHAPKAAETISDEILHHLQQRKGGVTAQAPRSATIETHPCTIA